MKEGRVSKYILKIMQDPKSLPHWEQQRFENLKRSEEAMKQIRKQVALAKRNGTYRAGEDGEDGDSKAVYDPSAFDAQMKLNEDKPLSDSEQEEIDEQICGQNTTRQFAEYKARALGDLELADKIRNN